MPDCEDGTGDLVEHAGYVRAVDGDTAQRVGGRHDRDSLGVKALDDARPARAVGEGAVYEHDCQRRRSRLL